MKPSELLSGDWLKMPPTKRPASALSGDDGGSRIVLPKLTLVGIIIFQVIQIKII